MGTTIPPDRWDWAALARSLDEAGYALTPPVFAPSRCADLVAHYDRPQHWRSHIDMARYRFGSGEYKYFDYPLPEPVAELREAAYPHLAGIANAWQQRLGTPDRFPDRLADFLARCHAAGQVRPTPLLLRYRPGDYNCLHQDIYGEHAFPLQLMVALSNPDTDYTGGEFLLVENVPRAQSRGRSITVPQGHGVIWATRYRPAEGSRGYYRVAVRHGVSTVHSGLRHALGVIFHDAT